jgi:Family of unknown function (DUF6529)
LRSAGRRPVDAERPPPRGDKTYFGLEEGAFHAVTGALLLAVLAVKIVVLRWWHAAGRFLPVLGITVFLLLAATWLSTAGAFLA